MQKRLRTYFLAGLGFLLPIGIAFLFLKALFLVISGVTRPFFVFIFSHYAPEAEIDVLVRLASFVTTILLVLGVGFIVTRLFGKTFVKQVDNLFSKIPVIAEIYDAVKKLTGLLASEEGFEKRFRRVVLIEYPRKGLFSLGLVTSEDFTKAEKVLKQSIMVVFIPTPPNPVNGMLVLVPKDEIIPLDLRVDEAIRIIFSIGLAAS